MENDIIVTWVSWDRKVTGAQFFSFSISLQNMADLKGVMNNVVVAFLLKFALHYTIAAQENSESTPAIQATVTSSQSGAILSSISPTMTTASKLNSSEDLDLLDLQCPDGVPCNDLGASCIQCEFNYSCLYGKDVEVQCKAIKSIKCTVSKRYSIVCNRW